jgi:hypothetical protein
VPVNGVPGELAGVGEAAAGGRERAADLGEQVREALAGLDEVELAAHPEAFEALGAAIVAELRSLEEL